MANPNPPLGGLRPFKKGQSGNPGGKTSAQRKLEVQNAEKATIIRQALVDQVLARVKAGEAVELDSDLLRLLKDTEDRGLGAPKQETEVSGDLGITQIVRRIVDGPGD